MKNVVLKFGLMGLLTVAVAGTPAVSHAQTNKPVLPGLIEINKDVFPFRGNLSAIDNKAKTITINNNTIQITPQTTITKLGRLASLTNGVPGDLVSGTYRKEADGKLKALDLRFAPGHPPLPTVSKTNNTNKAAKP